MTPISARRTVRGAAALTALAVALSIGALGPGPARAADLEALRARAQDLGDRVSGIERRLDALRDEKADLEAEIQDASRAIGTLEQGRVAARASHQDAKRRFIDQAVDLYKNSSSGVDLTLILSSKSIGDLLTFSQAANSAADSAAGVLAELRDAERALAASQERIDRRKQRLIHATTKIDEVTERMEGTVASRRSALRSMNREIRRLEEEARREAAASTAPNALQQVLSPGGSSRGIPDGFVGTGVSFEGVASWYGPGFEGNRTANGEIFDSSQMTAASKELPFNTHVFVQFQGKGVVVRINDRGPYIGDRIIDLSRGAAEVIGMSGIGWIKAEIVVKQ